MGEFNGRDLFRSNIEKHTSPSDDGNRIHNIIITAPATIYQLYALLIQS